MIVNLLIQMLTLISGLLINFVIPGLYGLDNYGAFIKANVLVFLFQRLLDIINEQLLASLDGKYVLAMSIFVGMIVFSIFCAINTAIHIGDPQLLSVMLLSSASLLSLFGLRLYRWILAYLGLYLLTFCTCLAIGRLHQPTLGITQVLYYTNLIPSLFAVLVLVNLGSKIPKKNQWASTLRSIFTLLPRIVLITLVFNLFTNILPYILSRTLPIRDLGLFRVTISTIQAATSLFPINVRAIFVAFVTQKNRQDPFRTVMSAAMLYFSAVGLLGYATTSFIPGLSTYLVMLPCLPVLYWAVVTERYLVASGAYRPVIAVNCLVSIGTILSIIIFANDVKNAELLYSVGFSTYLLLLHLVCKPGINLLVVLWVAIIPPLAIVMENRIAGGVAYMCSLLIISLLILRFRPKDLRRLRF